MEGLAAIGFGAALFLQPAITLIVLTTFLGAYWLVDGLFKVVAAFSGQSQERSWWIMLLSGLLGIFAGIIVFGAPLVSTLITQVFLVYMLAVQAIIGGLLSIVWAIRAREIRGEGWAIAGGILAILLGVVLMSSPCCPCWCSRGDGNTGNRRRRCSGRRSVPASQLPRLSLTVVVSGPAATVCRQELTNGCHWIETADAEF